MFLLLSGYRLKFTAMNLCRLRIGRNLSTIYNNLRLSYNEIVRLHKFSTNSQQFVAKKHEKQPSKLKLKTPKGTFDHSPSQMALRQKVFGKIESIFKNHSAVAIDTPVFELKEVLTGKYGEDSKLLYELADQGGEILALRYDLTVPFARYLAMNKISSIKRYHIGKVYRRDEPAISKGRLREFYQCDFDIVGLHDPMLPDVECIKVVSEVLNAVGVGQFVIRLNHRQILNGLLEACGVPKDKFKSISSAIDKLDKLPWQKVRSEMVDEKGLNETVADKIGEYVQLSGHVELIHKLLQDELLNKIPSTIKGLEELKLLLKYCDLLGIQNDVIFDLSLARGLDYYTGAIFEAVLKDTNSKNSRTLIGSIAAGGRYDDLIGIYNSKHSVPCVGVSIGVERIFSILESKEGVKPINHADIYVISAHKGLHEERLKIVNRLWNAGIRTEHSFKQNPKILRQIEYCEKHEIPYGIIIGDSELEGNVVKFRTISTREEIEISIDDLENEIRKRIDEKN